MEAVTMSEIIKKREESQIITSNFNNANTIETVDMREIKRQKIINYYKEISSLPKKINDCTFEKAIVKSNEEKKAKRLLEKYCKNFEEALKTGAGIYIYGVIGTGKTFYSLCVFNELSKNYKVYRTTLKQIYRRIKGTWDKLNITEEAVYKDLLNADLIILDDLGKEYISDKWGKDILYEIFNLLYEQEKCLIISTNLDTEQMAEYTDTQGSEAIMDRWRQSCYGIKFNWESRRKEIKQEIFKKIFEIGG